MNDITRYAAIEATQKKDEMVASAKLLRRRLDSLISTNGPMMHLEIPIIISLLARMRDSIETWRRAESVHAALVQSQQDAS